jgi:hypothetical protein
MDIAYRSRLSTASTITPTTTTIFTYGHLDTVRNRTEVPGRPRTHRKGTQNRLEHPAIRGSSGEGYLHVPPRDPMEGEVECLPRILRMVVTPFLLGPE